MKVKNALQTITTEGKTHHWGDCTHIICMLAHLHLTMIYDKQGYLKYGDYLRFQAGQDGLTAQDMCNQIRKTKHLSWILTGVS